MRTIEPDVRAALPDLATLAITIAVPIAMSTGIWGVLQRVMFVAAALWYGNEARLSRNDGRCPGRSLRVDM